MIRSLTLALLVAGVFALSATAQAQTCPVPASVAPVCKVSHVYNCSCDVCVQPCAVCVQPRCVCPAPVVCRPVVRCRPVCDPCAPRVWPWSWRWGWCW